MSTTRSNDPQPAPIPDSGASVTDAAIAFLRERREFGRLKYGTELCTDNGRDAMLDLRDELADALLYATQEITERDERIAAAVAKGRRELVRLAAKAIYKEKIWDVEGLQWFYCKHEEFRCSSKFEAISEAFRQFHGLTIDPAEIASALADESEVGK